MKFNEAQKVYFPAVDEHREPLESARDGDGLRHYRELWRLHVPGGWLILESGQSSLQRAGVGGVCFLPDPNHEWDAITRKEDARTLGVSEPTS
jgi:hypothetical protein